MTAILGNIESLNREKIMKNAGEILKRLFVTGAIVLIFSFTLFSLMNYILTSIYTRRREFSVLKSIGMGYKSLRRMILYENTLMIIISAVIGSCCAYAMANVQFMQYREGASTIEIVFPYEVFIGVVLVMLLLSTGIALLVVRKLKHVNIMDALKNENT